MEVFGLNIVRVREHNPWQTIMTTHIKADAAYIHGLILSLNRFSDERVTREYVNQSLQDTHLQDSEEYVQEVIDYLIEKDSLTESEDGILTTNE